MRTAEYTPNRTAEDWLIEQRESQALTTIAGLLMTSGHVGIIAVSARLSDSEKERTVTALQQRLTEIPLGTATTILI